MIPPKAVKIMDESIEATHASSMNCRLMHDLVCIQHNKETNWYRMACGKCGGALSHRISRGDALVFESFGMKIIDSSLAKKLREDESAARRRSEYLERKKRRSALDEEWKKWYSEVYLRSPEWKAKREQIKIRDEGKCVECGNTFNLQVHHKSYVAVSPALPYGRENPNDLVTLCDLCHVRKHPHKLLELAV